MENVNLLRGMSCLIYDLVRTMGESKHHEDVANHSNESTSEGYEMVQQHSIPSREA
jgi:hypothetical protein